MNYMFLKQCVESRPIAPIQQKWLGSIVSRVVPKVKESPKTNSLLQELCMEVSNDFRNVIVKHTGIVNYIRIYKYLCLQSKCTHYGIFFPFSQHSAKESTDGSTYLRKPESCPAKVIV